MPRNTTMLRHALPWLALLLSVLPGIAGEVSAFAQLLPVAKTLPAPPGIKEGTRLTYYSSAATIPGVYHSYHLDTDGNWIDEKGNRYRREDEPGTGGHGYTHVDVVALAAKQAVLRVSSVGLQPYGMSQAVLPISETGAMYDTPAAAGDFWVHPHALTSATAKAGGGVKIVNMPYVVKGKTYQAVRFQYDKPNSRMVYVFDRATGVLLHSNGMVKDNVRTMLTQNTLETSRHIAYPWAQSAVPSWLSTVKTMRGSGTVTVSVPYSPTGSMPFQVSIEVRSRGARWLYYQQTAALNIPGMPSAPETKTPVSGIAQFGGLWAPPAGLAALKAQQLIDKDPVTGVKLTVVDPNARLNGQAAVVMLEQGAAYSVQYVYDKASGALIRHTLTNRPLNTVTDAYLQRQ